MAERERERERERKHIFREKPSFVPGRAKIEERAKNITSNFVESFYLYQPF
jgi:hypothetical protein